jgi:hypothetical protein
LNHLTFYLYLFYVVIWAGLGLCLLSLRVSLIAG